MADHGKLKQSLGRLNDKGAEAKSFFKEIYECNIKNQEWWDQFAETDGGDDGWLNYILLNRAEFINELSNWNFVAKREASRADKGRISLWVEFWYLFANQWFKRRHRPPQKNLEEFSFFFALYSEAMTSTSSWDAKIKKLKDSGVEKDLRKSWKEFKEIQGKLDFIINEDTKNHIFDENGIITSNPGSRFIISLISGNPATEKVLDFWWNLRILIHKKTGTVSEESKKEVRKSWLELHKRLEDDESIVNSLEEIIQPAKPEIKEFSDALDAISSEEKSVDDYKEEILMELIEQILFFSGELETSKADRKKLMAAFVFDREALKKYGKVLSVFYTSGRDVSDDAAAIIKMAKSLGKNIKIENLSLKQLEKQFFKIQEVHRYTLETYPFWAEMASIIRERKAIGDIERKMLNPIINHYGDLLMLDFK